MRLLLQLLALLSLLVAPLAAPAAAITARSTSTECTDLAMQSSGHEMPAGHHGQDEACCIAVPPAIGPSPSALDSISALDHLVFVIAIRPFYLGSGPSAEDPPPRIA